MQSLPHFDDYDINVYTTAKQSNSDYSRKDCVKFNLNHTSGCKTRKSGNAAKRERERENWLARQTFCFWNDSYVECLCRVHWHQEFTSADNRHRMIIFRTHQWRLHAARIHTHTLRFFRYCFLMKVRPYDFEQSTDKSFVRFSARELSFATSFSSICSCMGEINVDLDYENVKDWKACVETIIIIIITVA